MSAFQAGLMLLRMENYPHRDELSGTDVLVLVTLASFTADGDEPVAFPSAARVATRSRLSRRTVQRSLETLELVGAIIGVHQRRKPTRWSFDPHFLRARGDGTTPREPVTDRGGTSSSSAKTSPRGDSATPVKRLTGARQASQRRTAGVAEAHQSTEVRSGAKRRNRTDVPGGSASGEPARFASLAPSAGAPAGPSCAHGIPGGLTVSTSGQLRCGACRAIAPQIGAEAFWGFASQPGLRRYLQDVPMRGSDPKRTRLASEVAEAVWLGGRARDPMTLKLFQAWVVEQLEPGRVRRVLSA